MQLSAIQSKIYLLTKTNSTSFPSSDLNQAINNVVEHIEGMINVADQRWQFDDTNQTDLPVATTSLVSGQQDYSLTVSHLSIDRVEVKDSSGNWTLLAPIDQHDIRFQALAQGETSRAGAYFPTAGIPLQYDKMGNSVLLYPTPNYSQSASLKIYFTRGPVALANPTDVPGFNSLFHDLICYWVAYEYCLANQLPMATGYFSAIQLKVQSLKDFYGQRSRDERRRMSVSTNGIIGAITGVLGRFSNDSNR